MSKKSSMNRYERGVDIKDLDRLIEDSAAKSGASLAKETEPRAVKPDDVKVLDAVKDDIGAVPTAIGRDFQDDANAITQAVVQQIADANTGIKEMSESPAVPEGVRAFARAVSGGFGTVAGVSGTMLGNLAQRAAATAVIASSVGPLVAATQRVAGHVRNVIFTLDREGLIDRGNLAENLARGRVFLSQGRSLDLLPLILGMVTTRSAKIIPEIEGGSPALDVLYSKTSPLEFVRVVDSVTIGTERGALIGSGPNYEVKPVVLTEYDPARHHVMQYDEPLDSDEDWTGYYNVDNTPLATPQPRRRILFAPVKELFPSLRAGDPFPASFFAATNSGTDKDKYKKSFSGMLYQVNHGRLSWDAEGLFKVLITAASGTWQHWAGRLLPFSLETVQNALLSRDSSAEMFSTPKAK